VVAWIPGEQVEIANILQKLKQQHLDLRTGLWWVYNHEQGSPKGVWVVLGADDTSVEAVKP
jgi:hypothetical protein